jgi:WD40 repeat protein
MPSGNKYNAICAVNWQLRISSHCIRLMDGDQVLSGSDDGTLKLWKLQNMEEVRTFFGHSGPVTALAVRSDGTSGDLSVARSQC